MSRICVYTHCPLELIRSRVYLRVMDSHLCSQTTEMDFGSPNVYSVYQGHYAHKVTNSPSWTRPLYDIMHALTATDDLPVVCTTILCRLFQAFTAVGSVRRESPDSTMCQPHLMGIRR